MDILLAVDGSEVSHRAVERVISLAGEFKAQPRIHILYVHLPVPMTFATRHVSKETLDAYYRDEGEKELAPARAQLDAAGVTYTPHVHVGHPGETICHVAAKLGCSLIAMGSHGRGAIAGAVLGSIAIKVLQNATVPVLISK
ncbi:MAG TPA: universal stress protein [Rhodocyclaceae bacterium]|nr:universal stress protein [Rhodocyclaceae bacterium]HMV53556.1 universal stress protein [Rhodocyclaceae bacterium]HNA02610.1 universal stress protein [Rhodocyclaceae bacterium]HNB77123.1 universal stress protein [Rhodocyclaceae bacterium]HNC60170.1 universal stress protein [Rhodocyclaceae bacterium]